MAMAGEGGGTLSGGEKQHISIARCILKDAPIVILDEATASVDMDKESYIQAAISELVKGSVHDTETAEDITVVRREEIEKNNLKSLSPLFLL